MTTAVPQDGGEDTLAIATITVTYDPDPTILRRQQLQLGAARSRLVIDNASAGSSQAGLREITDAAGSELLSLPANVGLASAINVGISHVRERHPWVQAILLLDQDTEPGATGLAALGNAYLALQREFGLEVALNPALIDADSGVDHGFHSIRGLRWARVRRREAGAEPVRCASLNCSGTLASVATFDRVGGMDESYFLDMLDAEWSFRAAAKGVRLLGVPGVHFVHRMGQRSLRVWLFGWRVVPYRSPWRNRLVVRNTLRLIRSRHAPVVWKLWALPKLVLTLLAYGTFDRDRRAQVGAMMHGLADALRGRPVVPPPRREAM